MHPKPKLTFKDLPRDYESLCKNILLPRPIRSQADYKEVAAIADIMAPFIRKFSAGQDEYFEILSSLIEDYDRKHVTWPKTSVPADLFIEEQVMLSRNCVQIRFCDCQCQFQIVSFSPL